MTPPAFGGVACARVARGLSLRSRVACPRRKRAFGRSGRSPAAYGLVSLPAVRARNSFLAPKYSDSGVATPLFRVADAPWGAAADAPVVAGPRPLLRSSGAPAPLVARAPGYALRPFGLRSRPCLRTAASSGRAVPRYARGFFFGYAISTVTAFDGFPVKSLTVSLLRGARYRMTWASIQNRSASLHYDAPAPAPRVGRFWTNPPCVIRYRT